MSEFDWPWEYKFPPFFTLQPHEETRKQQLSAWADLFLKYSKHANKFNINVNETNCPLFCNETLNRKLSYDFIMKILENLQISGHAHPLDKRKTQWQVYWYTLDEYANIIYDWVQSTGQMNTVCTLYEICNGDHSVDMQFYKMDEAVLLKSLRILEERGKCEIIDLDGSYGVKFF